MSLNEEKILSGKFIFISYSHKDGDAVREDMTALLELGVRVWYDHNMRLGDNWQQIAERVITHENCVGVLFYNSPNSFISDAVQKEQRLTHERCERDGIKTWSVHLNGAPTADICIKALGMMADVHKYFNEAMPLQQKMFGEQILCIMREDSASTVKRIYDEIAEPYHLVDNEDSFLDEAQRNNIASKSDDTITLGKYVSAEYFGPERPASAKDQRFGIGRNLIQLGGVRYMTKDLQWKLMYVKDGTAVLLCTVILDKMTFDEGALFLSETFPIVAFIESDFASVEGMRVRYMTAEDAERCSDAKKTSALKLSVVPDHKHWWIDAAGLTEHWKKTYSDDFRYDRGFSVLVKKGIRPVLEIPLKSLNK